MPKRTDIWWRVRFRVAEPLKLAQGWSPTNHALLAVRRYQAAIKRDVADWLAPLAVSNRL